MVRAILDDRKTQTRRPIDWDISNSMSGDAASGYLVQTDNGLIDALKLYRYQKGDILYVRETFVDISEIIPGNIHYKASATKADLEWLREEGWKWKPSIHMPKEAARIFLRVTDVRIERIQDITPENSIAEGLEVCIDCYNHGGCYLPKVCNYLPATMKKLWDGIYAQRGYGWVNNPFVWVIEFERCEKQDGN